jgi:hypothetical protein
MKDSGTPSIGDLVVAIYDKQRDISCVGLVMERAANQCRILWSSENRPIGWWNCSELKVASPACRPRPAKKFNALNIHLTT